MTVTVRTYKDNGPYWDATVMNYQANCLRDLIFHTRMAMEDCEDIIAVFHDDYCVGLWEDAGEPELDGEGGWVVPTGHYTLRRPDGAERLLFNSLAKLCYKTDK